jgi:hypothetical protein
MATTYEKIASTTLASATTTITFSSIPSTYTDLRLVITFKTTSDGDSIRGYFNSDTGNGNYSMTGLQGNGSAASSYRQTNYNYLLLGDWRINGGSSTYPQLVTLDIFSYAGSTYKTLLNTTSSDYNGSGGVFREVWMWRSTAAITTLTLPISGTNNLAIGTSATLYGIKAA